MPIVASNEMPPEISPEAVAKAQQMRELLNSDLDEYAIADLVRAFDVGGFDLQMETWPLLTWKEQNAWRLFRGLRLRKD